MQNKKVLTPEQIQFCELWLARKQNGMTQKDIAEALGTTDRTLRRWLAMEEVKQHMQERAVEIAKESVNDVLQTLVQNAKKGNVKSIEIYLKMVGLLGADTKIEVKNDKEDRSTNAVKQEIHELKALLGEAVQPLPSKPTQQELTRMEIERLKHELN